MPIPFLFIGIGAVAAAIGVGKTVIAGVDQKDANETNKCASSIVESAKKSAKKCQKQSGNAIKDLGNKKIDILNTSIMSFIETFEKIHNIEFLNSAGLNELQKFKIDKQSFKELKEMGSVASSIAGGTASGAALGAITAFGAYGAVSTLGVCATTGTAIAGLSGVAATNATLAFLGGGALSVGGLGVAGGTAVLGGLVAGPALAVMGFIVGAKANANKDAAYSNLAKAREFEEEMNTVKVLCNAIRMRANMYTRLLLRLNIIFKPLINSLEETVKISGTDYSKYSNEQRKVVAASLSIVGAIKSVLDTPILTEDGNLTRESEEIPNSIKNTITDYAR